MLKAHAHRLVARVPRSIRLALANDPAETLRHQLGIHVVAVEQLRDTRNTGGWCDGVSLTADQVICFAPSPRSRRQNFTLLHEYGHLLVDEDSAALDWLADRTDPAADLERLCDAIAAEILLPASTVTQILTGNAPTPANLTQLYAASQASEEVCAIALAARLPARGAVVLVNRRSASVAFAASNGWPPLPIQRGLAIPARHPIRDLGTRQHWSGWTTPDFGLARPEPPVNSDPSQGQWMRAHAEAAPHRTTVVLLEAAALRQVDMSGLSREIRRPGQASDSGSTRICAICGNTSTSENYPCEDCGLPPCPACGRCRCL
jgi:Zn-dependent peptidase ImmA (M78 family)